MEPGGKPWRSLGRLRISSAWEPTAGPADLKESGPAGAGEPGLEERLQRDPTPARGAPPGAMATGSRTPGPDPQPRPDPAPSARLPSQHSHRAAALDPRLPRPLKWIRPLPVDSNAERSILRIPRGERGSRPLGARGRRPPTSSSCSLATAQVRAVGATGDAGGGAGTRGMGGDAGEAFPACAAPGPATGSRARTTETVSRLERRESGPPTRRPPRASTAREDLREAEL